MEHDEIRHKLSEYIDGTITAGEMTAIEEHLRTCTACSDALRELRKTVAHIRTAEEVEPPAWMTQQIMAKVRSAAKVKKSWYQRFFFPLGVKLPIQAVAVLFLAVTAYYIYQNINTAERYKGAPLEKFETAKPAAPMLAPAQEPRIQPQPESAAPAKKVQQAPEYKALDMKPEYEKPAPPVPAGKLEANVPAKPAVSASKDEKEATMEGRAAPQAAPPSMSHERTAPSAGALPQAETKSRSAARSQKAKSFSHDTEPRRNLERIILERHANGKPGLTATYEIIDSRKVKLAEERFNAEGERHGMQKEYYKSGQVKTEAQYGNGKLEWYREFYPDGVKKAGNSDYDWFWLKN